MVIITGATSGIGLATARAFTAAGAKVVPAARHSVPPCDVTRDDDVRQLVDRTLAEHGRIDILINNAGLGQRAVFENLKPADIRQVMEINFFGALRCMQAVLPVMRRQGGGQIVNVSSVIGVVATPRNSIYCASKAALRSLTEAVRLEVREAGIDVISVLPGYTDTPFFDNMLQYDGSPRLSPWRGQSPDRVAAAILRACRQRRREVTLSFFGNVGCWAQRIVPGFVEWSLRRRGNP